MLTKDDVKQIGNVMDEKMKKRFKKELKPIKDDIKDIKQTNEIMLRLIRHDSQKIQSLESRTSRIESHLHLPSIVSG